MQETLQDFQLALEDYCQLVMDLDDALKARIDAIAYVSIVRYRYVPTSASIERLLESEGGQRLAVVTYRVETTHLGEKGNFRCNQLSGVLTVPLDAEDRPQLDDLNPLAGLTPVE